MRKVRKIVVKAGKAVGIQLTDGEEIAVSRVIASSVDPYQLIVHFLGEKIVGPEIVAKLDRYEWGDSALVIYVALDGPVKYNAGLAGSTFRVRSPDSAYAGLFFTGIHRMPWRKIAGSAFRHHVQRFCR